MKLLLAGHGVFRPSHIDSAGFSAVIVLLYYCSRYCNCAAYRPIFIGLLIATRTGNREREKSNNTRQFISRYCLLLESEGQEDEECIYKWWYDFIIPVWHSFYKKISQKTSTYICFPWSHFAVSRTLNKYVKRIFFL